jgi:chemotaxis receptor (MCP) glutamine deamidase CheD
MDDEELFNQECKSKKICYIRVNETVVKDENFALHIDLGSCVSVILCGIDADRKTWLGANHLFKSRVENSDMALEQVAELYNGMTSQNVKHICCLGLFGGGYREKSLARNTAQRNVLTVMEALSLYKLNVELFQTGYSQTIRVLKSNSRDSFLIRHQQLDEGLSRIIEFPLDQFFH